jgi:hypothetical protein
MRAAEGAICAEPEGSALTAPTPRLCRDVQQLLASSIPFDNVTGSRAWVSGTKSCRSWPETDGVSGGVQRRDGDSTE